MNEKQRDVHINVPVLARVEGEGALELRIRGGRIDELKLTIFEPPRLFEKFLESRWYDDVVDIVARICGICPVAYQMSAAHAIESAFRLDPGPWVRDMRRLFYCGEWIESHALHIHLLALPDFLGYPNAIAMAADHGDAVRRGMHLQELGNRIVRLLGARSVHPVGARIGGFHRAPTAHEAASLRDELRAALPEAEELVRWLGSLPLPDDEQDFTTVALRHPHEYPMNEGRLVSSDGLDIDIGQYQAHFREVQVPHSTAFHSHLFPNGVEGGEGHPYLVGPLARLNLNLDRLPEPVRANLDAAGVAFPSRNMFHSAFARAVEIHLALLEAARILDGYAEPGAPFQAPEVRPGVGYGCTEAPRGILWHRYELDEKGRVVKATIVPPTSQNQARIEADLRHAIERLGTDRSDDELRLRGETVIRNYDPCISCSTHFLKLRVDRG